MIRRSSNFTKQIWVFNNSDAERIYLYANLLQKLHWKANPQHLDNFRRELNAETNVSTDRDLILTQTNVKLDQQMPCYFDTKKSMLKYPHFVATKDFMSTLPKESPLKGKRYEKCAVIGNSGSLKLSTCGSQIDGMDFVFRCNGAPLEGFVTDAGKRTDFLTFNPSILYKRFGGLVNESMIESYITFMKQYDSMVWYPCFGSRQLVEPCIKAISYHDQVDSRLVIGHPSHYVSIWEFWKRRGLRKKPSTGLYLVSLAATLCNEIHLYGFWPFPIQLHEGKVQETAYHYFNSLPFTSHHSSDSEFRLLLQMHMLGTVNLHMGTCTQ
ncbi:CMP-N-acetylneuraminate-poly-alpha-2,8-sialyltransferase-like [Strongylocentrotus purpuratus]|uniref:ST8 alpha-N-acetyl-neuraminide alpha-2,8-sialyltransferase 6 n=1 Tax=Strongylocentrotus purpuratus TaxID=7668 RepID=A0A7M7PM83_STRPU|nr:CMP-N-acetylneuraminate-poly-alpha-2,8-sialyltransferase-like [Strongylocentrotus purpuratus]